MMHICHLQCTSIDYEIFTWKTEARTFMFKVLALLLAILEATRPPVDSFLGNQVAGRTAHSVIQVPYVMKTSSFQSTVLMKTAGFHYRCVKQTNEPSKFSSLSPLCRLSSRWCCAHSFFFFLLLLLLFLGHAFQRDQSERWVVYWKWWVVKQSAGWHFHCRPLCREPWPILTLAG